MNTAYGIVGATAPEFRFDEWLANTDGEPLRLSDIDEPIIYLYNFQSWCPGCHSHGFPTMKEIRTRLREDGLDHLVKFVAVQTVFEGHETNTREAALESLQRHGLEDLALGHDSGHPPTIMADYRTGGTPWTVLIGPDRRVLANGFQVDADAALSAIGTILDTLEPGDAGHSEAGPSDNSDDLAKGPR